MNEDLSSDLVALLGEEGLFSLTEAYPGVRLYVPANLNNSKLPEVIGFDVASSLAKRYGSSYINVPVARELRALRRRANGFGNREIALALGITERAVERIFARVKAQRPEKMPLKAKKKDPRQIEMF